jgi:hypothetical protein
MHRLGHIVDQCTGWIQLGQAQNPVLAKYFLVRQKFDISAVNFVKSSLLSSRKTLLRRGCRASIPVSYMQEFLYIQVFYNINIWPIYHVINELLRKKTNWELGNKSWWILDWKEKPNFFFLSKHYKRSCKDIYRRFWVVSSFWVVTSD